MITKEKFRYELTEAFDTPDGKHFKELTWQEQNGFLIDATDQICDGAFGFSELETGDLICYGYIENLFNNKGYYVELTYDFEFEQDDVEDLIDKICDYYQEYLDMFRHFTGHN